MPTHDGHRNSVTATASTKEKLDWVLSMPNGATHVVNYKTQDFAKEVKKITGGKGVDVIIDVVGQSHWNQNIDSLAIDGRMTILSLLSGGSLFCEQNWWPKITLLARSFGSGGQSYAHPEETTPDPGVYLALEVC
jgi:NADPH:quinone reductase-like Zn-dependent oxidoreductase